MHTAAPAPDREHPTPAPAAPPAEPDLETRMAAINAEMTVRLERASAAVSVNAAAPETLLDLADVITGPVTLPEPDEPPYPTPAAATLQRATRRLAVGGWCQGSMLDTDGARCLYGAVRAETPTPSAEVDALTVLLDAIRRRFPNAETVPSANDTVIRDGAIAVQLLGDAARIADARGL